MTDSRCCTCIPGLCFDDCEACLVLDPEFDCLSAQGFEPNDEAQQKADIAEALMENVASGYLAIVGHTDDGEPLFQITPQGKSRVEELIGND